MLPAVVASSPAYVASHYAIASDGVSFIDVSGWYQADVEFMASRGIMTGSGDGRFNPNGTMTRAMAVAVLFRLSGDSTIYNNAFMDVLPGAWYENAVAWAADKGIVSGVGGDQFAPDSPVSREQFAVMLFNYAKYKGYDVSVGEDTNILSYNDAFTISEYAYPGLQWACGAGVINGDDAGNLNHHAATTRGEAAAMLKRFIEDVVK
jgi:hypothetical protein